MSEPFIGEIRMVGFSFAPQGWAFCDGQLLPINQNEVLYSLLETTFGGDGQTSFALPDLRGRTPMHVGNWYQQGQQGGYESVTLTTAQMPAHTHGAQGAGADATTTDPSGALLAQTAGLYRAYDAATSVALRSGTLTNTGGGQAHNNMQPYLAINFCIALQGIYPVSS
ncbi:MAG: microcystin-dependent protein [Ilumatobacter sp.]|jgi:microcystin-dependent protein